MVTWRGCGHRYQRRHPKLRIASLFGRKRVFGVARRAQICMKLWSCWEDRSFRVSKWMLSKVCVLPVGSWIGCRQFVNNLSISPRARESRSGLTSSGSEVSLSNRDPDPDKFAMWLEQHWVKMSRSQENDTNPSVLEETLAWLYHDWIGLYNLAIPAGWWILYGSDLGGKMVL